MDRSPTNIKSFLDKPEALESNRLNTKVETHSRPIAELFPSCTIMFGDSKFNPHLHQWMVGTITQNCPYFDEQLSDLQRGVQSASLPKFSFFWKEFSRLLISESFGVRL